MEFAVIGGDLRIRWDNVSKAYEVMFPGKDWATISPMGIGGNPNYASAGSNNLLSFSGRDLYSYTGIVQTVAGDTAVREVYGIGTPASGVPVTGSASYTAQIFGTAGKYYFDNNGGHFDFDFAAGTLAGYFDPIASTANDQDSYELGRYDFVQTVFSGSQKFSGNLSHDGASAGSFSGLFTGPQAQELMGQWGLTFHDPVAPATTLNASGLFIGKKNP